MYASNTALAFIILIAAIIAIPLIITMIYKALYNRHVNQVLDGSTVRRWHSPLLVFLLALIFEIIVVVMLGMTYWGGTESGIETGEANIEQSDSCETYTQDEIDGTLYAAFDGNDVSGYTLYTSDGNNASGDTLDASSDGNDASGDTLDASSDGNDASGDTLDATLTEASGDDFTCQLYRNEDGRMLPKYIIRIEYTGSEDVKSWESGLSFGDTASYTAAEIEGEVPVLYVLISDAVPDDASLVYSLNLYTTDANSVISAIEPEGTEAEAAASLTLELQ